MIMVERHNINGTPEIIRLCSLSRDLYNECNYLMRRAWFGRARLPDISSLVNATRELECFKQLHNTKTAKQTIRKVLTDWSNFRKARNAYNRDPSKFLRSPKPPYYKDKMAQVIFFSETIAKKPLKSGILTPTNNCFSVKSDKPFKQAVITPTTFGFIVEISYVAEAKPKAKVKRQHVCCIDIGTNNLCAITSDQRGPLLINGRILKSINQWYNKRPCKSRSRKRYWRLENYFHHVSNYVVQLCIDNQIGRIIIGKNDGWKQRVKMRKKDKQNFQYIPFYKLLEKIKYKAEAVGIAVLFPEEAYTSKSSFYDRDPLPSYEEGTPEPTFSGRRVKRGLYCSGDGRLINADVNGSGNIGRKVLERENVIGNEEDVLFRLDRSLAARPVVINPLRLSA